MRIPSKSNTLDAISAASAQPGSIGHDGRAAFVDPRLARRAQREEAGEIVRDIESIDRHATFLFGKVNFLMDATVLAGWGTYRVLRALKARGTSRELEENTPLPSDALKDRRERIRVLPRRIAGDEDSRTPARSCVNGSRRVSKPRRFLSSCADSTRAISSAAGPPMPTTRFCVTCSPDALCTR